MTQYVGFPRLTAQNHRISSPATKVYNCIAWAANDTLQWWEPGVFWPLEASPGDESIRMLMRVFQGLGYEPCEDGQLEEGIEKVVLYGEAGCYTHAARQLSDGRWTSKLGRAEDIEHDTPQDVTGGVYGEILQFMKRPFATT